MELKKISSDLNINLQIEICNNGEECLTKFKEFNCKNIFNDSSSNNSNNYDLINIIFMDLQMPIMDGMTASKLIE